MWNNWVGRRIQASNRRQLVWSLAPCAIAALLLLLMHSAIDNYRHGPFPIDDKKLFAIEDPGDLERYWVTYENKDHTKPVAVEKSGNSKAPVAEYLLAPVHGRERIRPLLIRVPMDHQGDTFTGQLRAIQTLEQQKIVPALNKEAPGMLPYVLDLTITFRAGVIARLVLIGLLFAVGLWFSVRAVRRMRAPALHPLARALKRFGSPAEVAEAIEAEAVPGKPLRVGPVDFIGSWLICRQSASGWKVFRLDDVVWAHKLVVRINGIPNYWAKLFDRHGEFFQVQASQKIIDGILTVIATISPWLIAGYDPQLEQIWKRNPKALIEAVEQRRQEYLASRPPPESKEKPPG